MKNIQDITRDMFRDHRTWPWVTHLCVKRGNPLNGEGKCGIVLRSECREGKYVVRNHPNGEKMYGGPFIETFDSMEALLAAGWKVD
jgi:hypothetical protein